MQPYRTQTTRGFTLIELSIVLIIIGLIVGAILVGESMKRGSGRCRLSFQMKRITLRRRASLRKNTAFRPVIFRPLPLIGERRAPARIRVIPRRRHPTCNGNGDGMIEGDGTGLTNTTGAYDSYTAWQQLANAGMIEGGFTGSGGSLKRMPVGSGHQCSGHAPSGRWHGMDAV